MTTACTAPRFGVTLLDFDVPAPVGTFDSAARCSALRAAQLEAATGVLDGASRWAAVFTLDAAERPGLELLGQQLPDGQRPAGRSTSSPGTATARTCPARCTRSSWTSSSTTAAHPGALRCSATPVDLGRIKCRHLRDRRADRPPHAVAGLLPHHPAAVGGDARSCSATPATSPASSTRPATRRRSYFAGREPGPDPDEWLAGGRARTRAPGGSTGPSWMTERSGRRAPRADAARQPAPPAARAGARPLRPRPRPRRMSVSRAAGLGAR